MKILVTGITGLLGSYLTKELAVLGELHGLRRKNSELDLLGDLCDRIIWHEGDINDLASLEEAFEGVDMVVHAAGFISYYPKDKEELIRINVEGTANVVNVMLQKNIKKLIHISSVAALGRAPQVSFIDENFKWVTSPLNTPYGTSKYLGELEVWRAAQEGLDVMVFNPSVLLGKITDRRSSTAIYNYVLKE
jgi:dihydroflavonol-4-reductase